MMSDCSLTNTQSEANPGFNFARFEKGTRYYTIILDRDLFDDWVIIPHSAPTFMNKFPNIFHRGNQVLPSDAG